MNKSITMLVSVVGIGYVGLTVAASFSKYYKVLCLDRDISKIDQLNKGYIPIFEPGLMELITQAKLENNITFTTEYSNKLASVDVLFITVGTPTLSSGESDLSQIYNVLQEILPFLSKKTLIVIKSTVPPGTNKKLLIYIKKLGFQNDIASNPEFLKQGTALLNFLNPDRIVFGANNDLSKKILMQLYEPWIKKNNIPIIATDPITSELTKQASNAFLATKLSFINEISDMCAGVGANIQDLICAIGSDKRIGDAFFQPGPGFGGSCLPKDTLSLLNFMKSMKIDSVIIESVLAFNNNRKNILVKKIINILGKSIKNKTLGILGISFKAGTDDVRDSPAINIINMLQKSGANIQIYDPYATKNGKEILKNVAFVALPEDTSISADAILVLTEWHLFRNLNFISIYKNMKSPIIIDLRNLLLDLSLESLGFQYYHIGSI